MFISIGINCDIATILRDKKLRTTSLPFDWICTPNGVHEIIENDFQDFLTTEGKKNIILVFLTLLFPMIVVKLKNG